MAPSGLPQYAAVPSASTASLSKISSSAREGSTSEDLELDLRVYGPDDPAEESEYDGTDGRKGLLSGREKGADEEDPEDPLSAAPREEKRPRRSRVRSQQPSSDSLHRLLADPDAGASRFRYGWCPWSVSP